MREQKRAEILKEKRALSGPTSAPRVIVLFGLSACVNLDAVEEDILSVLSEGRNTSTFPAVASSEYRLRATVLKAPHGDLVTCMEMAKVADLLAFVATPNSLYETNGTDSFIDSFGLQCLSVFRTLGLPSTAVLIRDLPDDLKRKQELKKMCMSMLASEFPEDCKFYPADKKDELHKFMWLFKELRLTAPHWRNQRPYLMAQKVDMVADDTCSPEKCTLVLSGYLRAHCLSVNQLVHIAGAGDFQLSKIELLRDPCLLNLRKGVDVMDSDSDAQVVTCLTPDPMKQEPLLVENIPDPSAGEQVRLLLGLYCRQHGLWMIPMLDYSDNDEGDDDGMIVDGENGIPDQKLENGVMFDDDPASH